MKLDANLLKSISEESGIPIEEITSDKDVFDDLDMDSLDLINVVTNFEYSSGLRVEMNDFIDCRTVGDFSDRFYELQAESVPLS